MKPESDKLTGRVGGVWVFGYGSLIWRPGFEYDDKQVAVLAGYQRSFSQASHDHRGTAEAPGRVVTLAPSTGAQCKGVAFRLPAPATELLSALDIREQDGYERTHVEVILSSGASVSAITWIASRGNPSWRDHESLDDIAQLIAYRKGPSGTNREYLFELEGALEKLEIRDEYINDLSVLVRALRYREINQG